MTGTDSILIVEDDAILAAHLQGVLGDLGYQVAGLVATGEDAVRMALARNPDAILMDVRLRGEMTGIQAAVEIHQHIDAPVIYLTAYTDESLLQQAKVTDAYAYLAKPVRERELRASLEMTLYKHKTEKRVKHLNQVLRAIRDVNQLITRERDQQRLLDNACSILVRTRGYQFVWIGQQNGDHFVPLASAGAGKELLDRITATAIGPQAANLPGPSSMLRHEVILCHDMAHDERYTPWQSDIEKSSFRSSAAIPMLHAGQQVGVLCVYADAIDVFDEEEIDLLQEVAGDMAFALKTMEEETARHQAEEALKTTERQLQLFVDYAPAAIAMFDRHMVYLAASRRYRNDYRLAEQDLIGHSHYDIFPEIPVRWKEIHQRCLAGSVESCEEDPFPRADGTLDWVRWEIHPWFEAPEEIGGIVLFSEVITASLQIRLDLQASEEKYRGLLESLDNVVTLLDPSGRFLYMNEVAARAMGRPREDLVGKLMSELFPPEVASRQLSYAQAVINENRPIATDNISIVQGQVRWYHTTLQPIHDESGRPVQVLINSTDITELKNAQQSLEELNRTLEQRVHERTTQLEASNKELEAFAYSISHDLRTPLRSIDGFSHMIEEEYASQLDAEGVHMIQVIRASTQKMDRLISDILALSRVNRTGLSISSINMAQLARQVYDELAAPEVQAQFTFSIAPLPDANGDPTLLRQVWVNLIANAIKYTLPSPEHRIEIGAYLDKAMAVFFVKDSGVGFDEEHAHKLFGVFQRLHREEDFEGTGVGLAIVQRIIHRHGGQTWAEGKINQGATFYFSLPVMPG